PFAFDASDTPGYWEPAVSLASGRGYLDAAGLPTAERPPGYPVFLAGVFLVAGGPSALAVQVAQALLGGLTAVATALLLARLVERRLALAGALLTALDPVAVGQAPWLLREALLQALVTALLLALALLRGRGRLLVAAALLVALTL